VADPKKPSAGTILVVDDDQDIAMVLEEFLKEEGYQVEIAYDGMQALSLIRVHEYDAVICDMMMPRMSGDTLYQEVERDAPWMARRFLFVSGMARGQQFGHFFAQKGVRWVDKPFHAEEVLQIVSEIIAEHKR